MAVVHVLKNWFLKIDEFWGWITPLLPDLSHNFNGKQEALDWVASYVTQPPKDFSKSWRDGILLCELADKFSPDLFHGHGILDPKNCLHNVSLALEIIKGSFNIDPEVTPEDIVICAPEAEGKLLNLLLKLKERVESVKTEEVESVSETNSTDDESPYSTEEENDSFAQGTGLVIGFLDRKASFVVFSKDSLSNPDLVVEIKGPDDTYCCERISRRSPKRKSALHRSGFARPTISQCVSTSQIEFWAVEETPKRDPKMIPLGYEINDDFISIGYIPLKTGLHTINIIWHGRYVTGSPFVAMVEDSLDVQGKKSVLLKPPILRKVASETAAESKKRCVRFKEPETNKVTISNVRSRRVLRYIVKIGTKDVIVEAESSEMLAPALQKLDLPDEDHMLGARRNSWGFVGDIHSQRRRSLMRQIGIDETEEDEWRPHKRSFSLDVSLGVEKEENDVADSLIPQTSVHHDHASNNVSVSDFDKADNSILSKIPRPGTVCEPFESFTSSESAKNEDKNSASEDEVFYEEKRLLVSSTPNMATQNMFPEHYISEVFCEVNNSNPEELKTEQITKLDSTTRNITGTQRDETSLDSTKTKETSLCEKQEENVSQAFVLYGKTSSKQHRQNAIHAENPPKRKKVNSLCSSNCSEHLSQRKEVASTESRKSTLSGTANDSYTPTMQELKKNLLHYGKFSNDLERMQDFDRKENKMLVSGVNNLSDYSQNTDEDNMYSEQCDENKVLSEDSFMSVSESYVNTAFDDSRTTGWNANTEERTQYCNTYNFENDDLQRVILDKAVVSEERYISKAVTSFNRTNKAHNEGREISCSHNKSNNDDQNFVEDIECENFPEKYAGREVTLVPSHKFVQSALQFHSNDVIQRKETVNYTGLENYNEAQECFPAAAKSAKSENTTKFVKSRRTFSHPYLKSTYQKSESATLSQIPYLTGDKDKNVFDSGGTEDKEFFCSSRMRKNSQNHFFESGPDNSTIPQECHSFTWPAGFLNSDKKSALCSENVNFCNPRSIEKSCEKDEPKTNDVPLQKPVLGETLMFSLRSYKDNHSSTCEEEIVPSNSVKDIVKDFHSRTLEYPSPCLDKTNNIYLRRTFFPPLASKEGRKTVKNHISKWEKFPSVTETENPSVESNKLSIRNKLSLYVNVQSKVAFWETAYHAPGDGDIPDKEKPSLSPSECADRADFELKDVPAEPQQNHADFDSVRDPDNAVHWKTQQHRDSSHPVTSERTEDSGISDDLLMCLKTSNHKRPPMLMRHRSLSDPCIRTSSTRVADFLSTFEENLNVIPSSLYCSSEEKSEEAVRESEDGNDEYIDDEIPDYAAMFLGDYISFTGLLGPERSSLRKESVTQYLQKLEDKSRHIFDPSLSKPHECRALGVGVHYGLVSMNNHFQVLTKGAGRGNLSVGIQGSGRHDVTKIIVTYNRNDIYDVIYQVLEPGYYIISVRWSDWSIPGSPFICKVTY